MGDRVQYRGPLVKDGQGKYIDADEFRNSYFFQELCKRKNKKPTIGYAVFVIKKITRGKAQQGG